MRKIVKKWPCFVSVVVGGVIASGVHAQGYIGGGIGEGHGSVPSLNTTIFGIPVRGSGDKTRDTSYKLYGGYQFTPNWGLELGYNNLGNKYSSKIEFLGLSASIPAKVDNWYLAGTGTLPLGSGFSLLGKLGIVRNNTVGGDICLAGTCVSAGSSHRTQPLIGVGGAYDFTKNMAVRLEYEDYGKITGDDVWGTGGSGAIKASSWNLSLKYAF